MTNSVTIRGREGSAAMSGNVANAKSQEGYTADEQPKSGEVLHQTPTSIRTKDQRHKSNNPIQKTIPRMLGCNDNTQKRRVS